MYYRQEFYLYTVVSFSSQDTFVVCSGVLESSSAFGKRCYWFFNTGYVVVDMSMVRF